MSEKFNMHYVAAMEEAAALISKQKCFEVMVCGCRKGKGKCSQSRMDVCLIFSSDSKGSGKDGRRVLSKAEVDELMQHAALKHLVARPFRDPKHKEVVEGICFCCADCCGYFLNREEPCDKGSLIQETDQGSCTDCGICVEFCYFGARKIKDGKLAVDFEECYGCGLCAAACPVGCVKLQKR
ncbi:MAG: 4Fe-4S binding protein [Candidatus Wallbacteria bacterium]|nr:4Fe-4S binding protein [Candidatus Wallbacteria bacterium]